VVDEVLSGDEQDEPLLPAQHWEAALAGVEHVAVVRDDDLRADGDGGSADVLVVFAVPEQAEDPALGLGDVAAAVHGGLAMLLLVPDDVGGRERRGAKLVPSLSRRARPASPMSFSESHSSQSS